ncbi:hypothetical protein [Gaetbulibacter saemankumensis]|uniref:hypothetical protein n=1 Tax=Gaetbulibacter saemankumensis TaxID=311208 RepID=UPI000428FD18|nr:hypothetical protein [Gaetbulibacter saemankumensis]
MTPRLKIKNLYAPVLIILLVLAASSELKAQDKAPQDLKDFKVVIETTKNGIKMQSFKGSAWIALTFILNDNQPQAINQFGMTELDQISTNQGSNLANFLFTVTKTNDGIELKGFEGTAWKNLKFSLAENEKQAIDQNGMTPLN